MSFNSRPYELLGTGRVHVRWLPSHMLEITEEQEEEVSYCWDRAVEQSNGHLFNGTFLNMVRWAEKDGGVHIDAHFAEYKYFYVHRLRPSLGLGIKAIGVSGITFVSDGVDNFVITAKRAEKMTQYAGYYEFVPSGTVDQSCAEDDGRVHCEAKLLEELHEEAGVAYSHVETVETIGFIHDRVDDSYDVCCRLRVSESPQRIIEKIAECPEYVEPELVRVSDLKTYAESKGDRLMPTSWAILEVIADTLTRD